MRSTAGDGLAKARLLVVDDEETILELLSGSLRLAGFEVITAASGMEALRAAAASRPDLILLDVMMPGMDGPEVCRRLKADPRTAGVPVVFLTALGDTVLAGRLGDCAHDGVLHKPFAVAELLAVVHRHLGV